MPETITLFESCINENPRYQPTVPREMEEFREMNKYEKEKSGEKFYAQLFIQKYMEDKWKAELHNHDCFVWLWDILQGETDDLKRARIRTKLKEFKDAIDKYRDPYSALRLDFTQYGFGVHSTQEWDE